MVEQDRFDGESARRILQLAVAEQQRLEDERAGSYSRQELEEMAAEAGISPEALAAAIQAEADRSEHDTERRTAPSDGRLAPLKRLLPRKRSTAVLAATGAFAFLGALLAFPAFAEAVFLTLLLILIAVAVLILLGAAPL